MPDSCFRLIPSHDAALVGGDDGCLMVRARRANVPFGPVTPGTADAMRLVFKGGATEAELVSLVLRSDGMSAVPGLLLLLRRLDQALLLGRVVDSAGGPFVSVQPTMAPVLPESCEIGEADPCRFSHFVSWRASGDGVVLESPLAKGWVTLHQEAAAIMAYHLSAGTSSVGLRSCVPDLPDCTALAMLRVVAAAGLLEEGDEGEGTQPAAQWEFHDLAFHARSRLGRHQQPYGATYRFDGVIDPPPATAPVGPTAVLIDLPPADLGCVPGSLADAMARRRSVRQHGDEPISLQQLATFLHRCQRLERTIATPKGDLASRPYPGGGALYELEVYPVVERCTGLESGLYHYVSDRHQLSRLADADENVRRLLDDAWLTLGQAGRPQVLLIITARFGRSMWKYQSMAYALILKDVGVLFQTMYLVATDMGLAPCALGGGDSDLFAQAAHREYLVEGSVGEFTLGSLPLNEPAGAPDDRSPRERGQRPCGSFSSTRTPTGSSSGGATSVPSPSPLLWSMSAPPPAN